MGEIGYSPWIYDLRCTMYDLRCTIWDVRFEIYMLNAQCSMLNVQCSILNFQLTHNQQSIPQTRNPKPITNLQGTIYDLRLLKPETRNPKLLNH